MLFSDSSFSPFKSLNSFTFALDYTEKTPFFKIFQKIISAVIPDADVLNPPETHPHNSMPLPPSKKAGNKNPHSGFPGS